MRSADSQGQRVSVGPLFAMTVAAIACCSCRGVSPNPITIAQRDTVVESAAPVAGSESSVRAINQATAPAGSAAASLHDGPNDRPTESHVARVSYPMPLEATSVTRTPMHYPQPGTAPCLSGAQACGAGCSGHGGRWIPPGIAPPWPEDEYLCDGGDQGVAVRVRQDWSVSGLDLEDTVVHYDTLDGQTRIEPTNRVCLYAPRFAAVRKIYGIVQHEHHERIAGVEQPMPPIALDDVQIATTAIQPVPPILYLGTKSPSGFRERTPPTMLENAQGLVGTHGGLLPFEDFALIRRGFLDNSEKARLSEHIEAALAWSHDQAVQVVIDNIVAHVDIGQAKPGELFTYELGSSRLRVCKIASKKHARPGETVEFTIRFDNVGDQAIGNVTVIDNLTTRLEYVEGSQSCTLKANFASVENQGESLVLRWEITEPMQVSQGGVIRFQCRVR